MISEKQRAIIDFIGTKTVKKAEIVKRFKHWYYRGRGADRYINDILFRLCKRNILERPKHGYYKLKRQLPINQGLFDKN